METASRTRRRLRTPNKEISTSFGAKFSRDDSGRVIVDSEFVYEFDKPQAPTPFVAFLTRSNVIRDTANSAKTFAFWDLWSMLDNQDFLAFTNSVVNSVRIGFRYRSASGESVEVSLQQPDFVDVPINEWKNYLSLFQSDVGEFGAQEVSRLYRDLQVLRCDFADGYHDLVEIESFTIASRSIHQFEVGFVNLRAGFDSYVESIWFDATEMAGADLLFNVVPFVFADIAPSGWLDGATPLDIPVRSWVAAGQGASFVWRDTSKSPLSP